MVTQEKRKTIQKVVDNALATEAQASLASQNQSDALNFP
jgi:hypothetical protein